MGTSREYGFTVIEVMLFLGVTGALFAALMVGMNTGIAQQRYKEAVVGYSSLLQDQYNLATTVLNDRSNGYTCSGGIVSPSNGVGEARGASPCVILGRAVEMTQNGTVVRTSLVIGQEPTATGPIDDISVLLLYNPKLVSSLDQTIQEHELDWGTSAKVVGQTGASEASLLILRSPSSGLTRVFAKKESLPDSLSDMITTNATEPVSSCIQGKAFAQPSMVVKVDPVIAGPDAVTVRESEGDAESC